MSLLVILFIWLFAFFGCLIWDSIIDRSIHREPSDWLGYVYLATIASLLGYGAKYLDNVRAHPYLSGGIVLTVAVLIGISAIFMWRKAANWDKKYHQKRSGNIEVRRRGP